MKFQARSKELRSENRIMNSDPEIGITEQLQILHNQKDLIDVKIKRKLKIFKLLRREYENYDVLNNKLEAFHLSDADQVKLLSSFLF